MSEGPAKRRWIRIALIGIVVVATIEAPFVVLALVSIIPYHCAWVSGPDGTTTIFRYWDGATVIEQHAEKPGWITALFYVVLAINALVWSAAGYGAWRWWKRRTTSPARH